MATAAAPKGKKENVLTRKIGPLPTWVWVAIIGGVILLWAFYQRSKSNSAAQSATSASTVPPDVFLVSPGQPGTPGQPGPPGPKQKTPPDNDADHDKDADDKKKTPAHHHRRHRARKHPTHHDGDHDADDRKKLPRGKPKVPFKSHPNVPARA